MSQAEPVPSQASDLPEPTPARMHDGPEVRPVNPVAEFQRRLAELTPRPWLTPTLIGLNVAVLAVMAAKGVNVLDPSVEDLIRWGANYGPKTTSGEWWRLFTCMFLHIGILHLAFNMWVLLDIGCLVERLVGNLGFALLYVLSGLIASLTSLYWNSFLVSAGASGAIFGVCGALLAFLLRRSDMIPGHVLHKRRNSLVVFVGYNLVYGLMQPQIDMAAHVGGLVAGFVFGLVLCQPLTPQAVAGRRARNLLIACVGSAVLAAGLLAAPKDVPDLMAESARFDKLEHRAIKVYNEALQRTQKGEISDAALADIVERDILPDWRAVGETLGRVLNLPGKKPPQWPELVRYVQARQDAWEATVQGLRENDPAKIKAGFDQQAAADRMAAALSAKAPGGPR